MKLQMLPQHQIVLERFIAACQADARIVAAFLGGSYARGMADAYSDLDLGLITTDAAFDDFVTQRETFLGCFGDLVFMEDFDLPNIVFLILHDGTEVELVFGRAGQFHQMHTGAYHVLIDKTGLLAGVVFGGDEAAPTEQIEVVRRLVTWFWHDLSHFITAMGRGQLWWAYGQLEELRRVCINLLRLKQNGAAQTDGYEKVDQVLPIEALSPLQASCCPLERGAMFQAARIMVQLYEEVAPFLAHRHGIAYPADLARVMSVRLKQVGDTDSI